VSDLYDCGECPSVMGCAGRCAKASVAEVWTLLEILQALDRAYDHAARISGSSLLAGETPHGKQAEQRALVYEEACVTLRILFSARHDLAIHVAAQVSPSESTS